MTPWHSKTVYFSGAMLRSSAAWQMLRCGLVGSLVVVISGCSGLWPAPQPWPSPFELAAASELEPDATVAAAFARLGTYDVAPARARRLRDRCHARLRARRAPDPSFDIPDGTLVRRLIGPALVGVWCLVYLIAILRFAAAVYGFEGI